MCIFLPFCGHCDTWKWKTITFYQLPTVKLFINILKLLCFLFVFYGMAFANFIGTNHEKMGGISNEKAHIDFHYWAIHTGISWTGQWFCADFKISNTRDDCTLTRNHLVYRKNKPHRLSFK